MKTFFAVALLACVASAAALPNFSQVSADHVDAFIRAAKTLQDTNLECLAEISVEDTAALASCPQLDVQTSFNTECAADQVDGVDKIKTACASGGCLYNIGTEMNKAISALTASAECLANIYESEACKEQARTTIAGLDSLFTLSPATALCASNPATGELCIASLEAAETEIKLAGTNQNAQCGVATSLGCCASSLSTLFDNLATEEEAAGETGSGEGEEDIPDFKELIETCGQVNVPSCPVPNKDFTLTKATFTINNVNEAFFADVLNQRQFEAAVLKDAKAAAGTDNLSIGGFQRDGTTVTVEVSAYDQTDAATNGDALKTITSAFALTNTDAVAVNGVSPVTESSALTVGETTSATTVTTLGEGSAGAFNSASLSLVSLVAAVAMAFQMRQ